MVQKFKEFLIKFHKWIQSQWFIFSFFLTTASVWFSLFLNFLGEKFKLIILNSNGKNQFTTRGLVCTIVIIIITFFITIAQRYYEYSELNSDTNKRKLFVLEKMDTEINKICKYKFVTLKKELWKIKKNKTKEFPKIISNPCNQLKYITEKMNDCLCELLS